MKNMKIKIFSTLVFVFSATLALVGIASASTVDTLQPASTITYNEEVVVNDTIRVDSAYIGKQDVGGVTFFNGTIVNSTTTDGVDNPVTFGDDVRIDGEIYRTQKGDDPLKISDTVIPTMDNTNDLGSSANQWKDGYFAGTLNIGALGGTGVVSGANITDGTITGDDISSSADLSVDAITATGDISQGISADGVLKAGALIDSVGGITRYFNNINSSSFSVTVNPTVASYEIDFNFDISDRYIQVTPYGGGSCEGVANISTSDLGSDDSVRINIYDKEVVAMCPSDFYVTIY